MGAQSTKELLEKNQYSEAGRVSPADQVYLNGRLYKSTQNNSRVVVMQRMYESKAAMLSAKEACTEQQRLSRQG